jgi:putative nucleotidyltransferase with HDIG domain
MPSLPPTGGQPRARKAAPRLKKRRQPKITIDRGMTTPLLIGAFHRTLASPFYQSPRLPDTALRLIELSIREQVMFDDIKPMLTQDVEIRQRVLAVAQSARYASRGRIENLEQAIVRMGLDAVTRVILEVSMQLRVYRVPNFPMESAQLHRHCLATAEVAAEVAKVAGVDARRAFLAGLLHDAGIAACLNLIAPPRRGGRPPDLNVVWPAVVAVHQQIAERLADRWSLPEDVAEAMASHHVDEGRPSPLVAVVAIADALVADAGVPAPEFGVERPLRRAAISLELNAEHFDHFRDVARRACEPHLAASEAAMRQREEAG